MDNDKYIGFTLIMLLIITYYVFFPPGQSSNSQEEVNNIEKNIISNEVETQFNQLSEVILSKK